MIDWTKNSRRDGSRGTNSRNLLIGKQRLDEMLNVERGDKAEFILIKTLIQGWSFKDIYNIVNLS